MKNWMSPRSRRCCASGATPSSRRRHRPNADLDLSWQDRGQMRWTSREVAAATQGRVTGSTKQSLTGVGIDSRVLPVGALFVAIRADRDGHDYLAEAVQAGAG